MAITSCPKCNNHSFEIVEVPVAHSVYKLNAVQCSVCGTPIGIQEYFNSGAKILEQTGIISGLSTKISNLEQILLDIEQSLRIIAKK